jgi:crotonobetaine/carnitine-CoA ligase
VRLVDEHDYPVPTGEIGEMIVRRDDPWEMNAGYLEQPDATLEAWRNGWFHTGDLFRCDDDGRFYFVDRQKDSLRRRGENISSFEVEHQVMQHPSVTQCACVGVPDEYGGDEVKVFLVVDDDSTFDHVDLIEFLRPRMPYFMIPRYVEVVGELPVTPTARVQKHLLRDLGNSSATWDREAAGIVVSRRD